VRYEVLSTVPLRARRGSRRRRPRRLHTVTGKPQVTVFALGFY
jgi:hypothetical protein